MEAIQEYLSFKAKNLNISFLFPLFLKHLELNEKILKQHRQKNMTAWYLGVRLTCQNLDRTTRHHLTNIGKRRSCCEHGKSQTNGLETGALFFFSPCLAIRARLVFCTKCSIHLAWLIKRLFCRLLLHWAGYLSISSLKTNPAAPKYFWSLTFWESVRNQLPTCEIVRLTTKSWDLARWSVLNI